MSSVTASQKSLMCPPGLAVVAVSEKAMRVVEAAHGIPRFFFDFRRAKASLDKGETPFTPPVSLILGLREALAMIDEEGLPRCWRAMRVLSAALRAGFEALGFPMFPAGRPFSPTVTVGVVPEGLDGSAIVRHMYANYRTVIAGQRTKLATASSASARWGLSARRTSSPTCTISNARCAISAARRRPARACRRRPRRSRIAGRRPLSYRSFVYGLTAAARLQMLETTMSIDE